MWMQRKERKIKSSFSINDSVSSSSHDDDGDHSDEKFEIDNFSCKVDYPPFLEDGHDPLYDSPFGLKQIIHNW